MLDIFADIQRQSDALGHLLYARHDWQTFNEVLTMNKEKTETRYTSFDCERCETRKATHELFAVDEDGDTYYVMLCDVDYEIETADGAYDDYEDRGNPNGKPYTVFLDA